MKTKTVALIGPFLGIAGAEVVAGAGPASMPENAVLVDRVETKAGRGPAVRIDLQRSGVGDDASSPDAAGAGAEGDRDPER